MRATIYSNRVSNKTKILGKEFNKFPQINKEKILSEKTILKKVKNDYIFNNIIFP